MKKPRNPSASLEHEVIYAVIMLYAGLSAVILGIHFLQPDRSKPDASPALARSESTGSAGAEGR